MADDFPKAGQVFGYHYLWKWQATRGETEGRKKRPSCVAVVVVNEAGKHVLFIAAITSKEPRPDQVGIAVPETEARRAKLDVSIPLWGMVNALNADVLESSYTLDERSPRGAFSPAFTDKIVRGVQSVRQAGALRLTRRT